MKSSLKLINCLCLAMLVAATSNTYAADAQTKTLLYISPNDYSHGMRLLHPYYDYWVTQGPLVEPIAFEALKAKDSELAMCNGNETANTIIRIKPHLFYNPQLQVYHSKLVASVYSGSGALLGTYIGEAQQQGYTSIDNGTLFHINKVYTLAMQDLMTKLQFNPERIETGSKLPCGMIGSHEESKFSFY